MESYTKSFHLQTPFITKDFTNTEDDTSQISIKNVNATNTKSERFPGEGTFAEVLEYNKHLTALKDLEILKNQYYEEYVTNLEKKVKQQRKGLSKSDSRNANDDVHEQNTVPHKKSKLTHHRIKHDKEYMRNVSKSKFYHFLAARDLMQKRGLIKNRSDEDHFWNRVIHDNFIWSQPIQSGIPSDAITRVMVNRFSSMSTHKRANNKDNRVKFGDTPSTYIDGQKDKVDISETDSDKVRDQTLKRLQVKMKLPKLHSMRKMTPLPKVQSMSYSDLTDTSKKLNRLEKLRTTKHAYDVAMVHHAVTRRMLRNHSLLNEKESEFLLHDMVALPSINSSPCSFTKQQNLDKKEEQKTFITEPVYGNDQVLIPELEYKYSSARKRVTKSKSPKKKQDTGDKLTPLNTQPKESQSSTPLNFSMMLEQGHLNVKKPKTLHTFWVNYADDT